MQAGLAVAVAGLLALCAWVWSDALESGRRGRALWALLTFSTAGLGAFVYVLTRRSGPGVWLRAGAGMGLWFAFALGLGLTTTRLSAHNRARPAPETDQEAQEPVRAPHWGAFQEVFPGAPPPPASMTPAK